MINGFAEVVAGTPSRAVRVAAVGLWIRAGLRIPGLFFMVGAAADAEVAGGRWVGTRLWLAGFGLLQEADGFVPLLLGVSNEAPPRFWWSATALYALVGITYLFLGQRIRQGGRRAATVAQAAMSLSLVPGGLALYFLVGNVIGYRYLSSEESVDPAVFFGVTWPWYLGLMVTTVAVLVATNKLRRVPASPVHREGSRSLPPAQ